MFTSVFAQDEHSAGSPEKNLYTGKILPIETKLTYNDVEGSPYMQEQLTSGQITYIDGKKKPLYMRYDQYVDEVEFIQDEKIYAIDNPKQVEFIDIGEDRLVYSRYYIQDIRYDGYLVLRVKDGCSFLVRKRVAYNEAKPANSASGIPTPAKFSTKSPQWFYKCSDKAPAHIPSDNTGLKQIAGSTEAYKVMKDYMKNNKLSFENESDMIKMFEFYNSLQAKNQ